MTSLTIPRLSGPDIQIPSATPVSASTASSFTFSVTSVSSIRYENPVESTSVNAADAALEADEILDEARIMPRLDSALAEARRAGFVPLHDVLKDLRL